MTLLLTVIVGKALSHSEIILRKTQILNLEIQLFLVAVRHHSPHSHDLHLRFCVYVSAAGMQSHDFHVF